jgi:glycosyltransferase involved in cell wall biosynthesis
MPELRKILMLSHGSGSYQRARGFGEYLAKDGYEVEVVTISEKSHWRGSSRTCDGLRVTQAPDLLCGRLRTGWDAWDSLWRTIRAIQFKPDLIKCYETRPVSALPAFTLRRFFGTPVITSWGDWWGHGGTTFERAVGGKHPFDAIFAPIETYFEEAFHPAADGVIVMSEALRKRALALGVPAHKIRVIHHGIDVDRVKLVDRAEARRALGIAADVPLFGYVGKIFPRDAGLLLEAQHIIQSQLPEAMIALIGNTNYKPLATGIPNLVLTGLLSEPDLLNWLSACDLFLLPLFDSVANRGRWPSKVPEYMAAQRAVVATAVGDVSGIFSDGVAGILTAANANDFANGVLRLYRDPMRDEMGRRGRQIAAERFAWSVQAKALREFIEEVYQASQANLRAPHNHPAVQQQDPLK